MPRRPSAKTVGEALAALDGLIKIARNEMLVQGTYISSHVENAELAAAGSVCRGHRACFVGSLWLGGGVEPEDVPLSRHWGGLARVEPREYIARLPGTDDDESRAEFLAERPGLRLAYNACNEAARRYINRNLGALNRRYNASYDEAWDEYALTDPQDILNDGNIAEDLFESGYIGSSSGPEHAVLQATVVRIAQHAKRLVRSDAVR